MEALLLGVVLLLAVAVGLFGRQRAMARRLRRRLDAATMELQHLQTSFARFAPQQVVDRIAGGGSIAAEKREVTVLFADLVGFTRFSEKLEPDVLLAVLNGYFARMSAVIGEHRGYVAKFIGDGLMALFGALEPNPWQANDAVHAALGMLNGLQEYNRELATKGGPRCKWASAFIGAPRLPVSSGAAVSWSSRSSEARSISLPGSKADAGVRCEHSGNRRCAAPPPSGVRAAPTGAGARAWVRRAGRRFRG